jgi:hypothetical protein
MLFEILPEPKTEPEPEGLSYSDTGRILFRWSRSEEPYVEVLGCDGIACWIEEGMGCKHYLQHEACLEIELDGVYVMEGITGELSKGYFGECDERWHFERIRRASHEEEEQEALFDD